VPHYAINWWFSFVDPVFTKLGLLDAVGNVAMLALCVIGWRKPASDSALERPGV